MSFSRKCVPFTPFEDELAKSTVALVTAGGVHLKDQEAFNIADELAIWATAFFLRTLILLI